MSAYSGFAYAYDFLMKDVDYDIWAKNIDMIYKELNMKPKSVLELGCGTGNITTRLYKKGYNMIGSDLSEDMLMIAQEKAYESNLMINFILQDMRDINYRKKVDSVISICDGLNYITTDEDLLKVFKSVYNVLESGGIFIFDISSYYKLKHILGTNTFAESHEKASYIWENYFNSESDVLDFDLTVFIKSNSQFNEDYDDEYDDYEFENDDEEEKVLLYERYFEQHTQKAHKTEKLKEIMNDYFEIVELRDGDTFGELSERSQRALFICKKKS
ncbi:MAG: class I SAM-dependent methyltransferase [Acidaminobacteraceae bacterium]